MVKEPKYISGTFIDRHHRYADLIPLLDRAFSEATLQVPKRLHFEFGATEQRTNSTLLLMPAWQNGRDLGIKFVTINPENVKLQLPAVQGTYLLMDAQTGIPQAIFEGKALTRKRTAATSALAASYLAPPRAKVLLMIGTGALAPELIDAHSGVRPIEQVYIWGRSPEKAKALARSLADRPYRVTAINNIRERIGAADIISTATLSQAPLIFGADLREGQHLDLVGAFKPTMRESDDEAVQRATVFVDTYQGAVTEAGDLAIPLQQGKIRRQDIVAELSELCSGKHPGRPADTSITLFKSVGYALEDLVAARYYWDIFSRFNELY